MSLTKVSLWEIVKRQYAYKLKAYIQVFMSMVIVQLIAILFSQGSSGMMASSGGLIDLELRYYSADTVVGFTILWGFITAILITTKAYRNDDFILVTNRLSSNLSNALFLLTASIVGGITSMLTTFLVKIIVFIFKSSFLIISPVNLAGVMDLLIGTGVTTLYILLFSAIGYMVGTLVQLSRAFAVVLPVIFVGGLILDGLRGQDGVIAALVKFFFMETSFVLFIVKVLAAAVLMFCGAFILSNKMEVKP